MEDRDKQRPPTHPSHQPFPSPRWPAGWAGGQSGETNAATRRIACLGRSDGAAHIVRLDAGGADVAAPRRAALQDLDALDVRVPAARVALVGEAHRHAETRVLAADVADGGHDRVLT